MKPRNKKKAFTIVELVVVIAVIAVLAAVLIPTFSNIVKKAQKSKDTQLVRNLNTALVVDGKEHNTMYDALDAAAKAGYIVDKINANQTDNEILWDSKNDVFCYREGNDIKYIPESNLTDADRPADVGYWRITKDASLAQSGPYSVYYNGETPAGGEVTTTVGFDAGTAEGITSITYNGSAAAQDVVIRTNSYDTALTIDDESTGSIYHYGFAGALNIIQCHTVSYHENGTVAFAEIARGRIVLENGSEIKHIHVNANASATGFDTVIIADNGAKALPEAITRDKVTVTVKTLVVKVESNGSSEEVYVYAADSTGTTEKTANQNEDVDTALGVLALDNGVGSKALNETEQTDTKTEIVTETKQNACEHEWAEIVDDKYLKSPASVTAPATYYKSCSLCGKASSDTFEYGTAIQLTYTRDNTLTNCKHTHTKTVDGTSTSESCTDGDSDDVCDYCQESMIVEVYSIDDFAYVAADWARINPGNTKYKLMNNITCDKVIYFLRGTTTLDLNGKTFTHNGSYWDLYNGDAVINFIDSSVSNGGEAGKIVLNNYLFDLSQYSLDFNVSDGVKIDASGFGAAIFRISGSSSTNTTLNVSGVDMAEGQLLFAQGSCNVTLSNCKVTSASDKIVEVNPQSSSNTMSITLEDCELTSTSDCYSGLIYIGSNNGSNQTCLVTVKGSTISVNGYYAIYTSQTMNLTDVEITGKVEVNGGKKISCTNAIINSTTINGEYPTEE